MFVASGRQACAFDLRPGRVLRSRPGLPGPLPTPGTRNLKMARLRLYDGALGGTIHAGRDKGDVNTGLKKAVAVFPMDVKSHEM
jgi:hypothetical protein